MQGGHRPLLPPIVANVEKKTQGGIAPPPLPITITSVVKKTHGGITPPSLLATTKLLQNKSLKGITPVPLPLIIVITTTKNTRKAQFYICMLEIKREHDITSPCNYCKPKTQGEHDGPPPLSFCCWVCNKKHAHTQTTRTITKPKTKNK
jgi:hypothetical protein